MAERLSFVDFGDLCRSAAEIAAGFIEETVRREGSVTMTLSGGSTPRELYGLLAESYAESIPWDKVHLLWGDERYVPFDSKDSNYRMAHETLVSKLRLTQSNVHPFRTDLPGEKAAQEYSQIIQSVCRHGASAPQLDLVFLGLGPDGHTASLFPGSEALESPQLAAFVKAPELDPRVPRLTMTLPLLNTAALVIFLVAGKEKLAIVEEILAARGAPLRYPASRVQPVGRVVWLTAGTP